MRVVGLFEQRPHLLTLILRRENVDMIGVHVNKRECVWNIGLTRLYYSLHSRFVLMYNFSLWGENGIFKREYRKSV